MPTIQKRNYAYAVCLKEWKTGNTGLPVPRRRRRKGKGTAGSNRGMAQEVNIAGKAPAKKTRMKKDGKKMKRKSALRESTILSGRFLKERWLPMDR